MSPLLLPPTLRMGLLGLQLAASPPVPGSALDSGAPAAVNPELAAEATVSPWVPEGGADAHTTDLDPRASRDQMRRAARATIAGGAVTLLGMAGTTAGTVLYIVHGKQLAALRRDNGGQLPPGDGKRQTAIRLHAAVIPTIAVGSSLVLAGLVTALVAGRRFKRLREQRRTSTVAFAPAPTRHGFGMAAGVRF